MKTIKNIIITILLLLAILILLVSGIKVVNYKWYEVICWLPMAIGFWCSVIYALNKFDRWFFKQLK